MLILLQPFLSRPTRQKHGESEASSHLQDSMPVKKKHQAQCTGHIRGDNVFFIHKTIPQQEEYRKMIPREAAMR